MVPEGNVVAEGSARQFRGGGISKLAVSALPRRSLLVDPSSHRHRVTDRSVESFKIIVHHREREKERQSIGSGRGRKKREREIDVPGRSTGRFVLRGLSRIEEAKIQWRRNNRTPWRPSPSSRRRCRRLIATMRLARSIPPPNRHR